MNGKIKRFLITLTLPICVYLLFCILAGERFANLNVLRAIFIQSFIPLLCAYGMVFGRAMRMLDLSIGSRIIAASMIGGVMTIRYDLGVLGLVAITIVVCLLLGVICGLVFTFFKIPSIVVSLVIAMVFEVIGAKVTGGMGFLGIPVELAILGKMPYNLITVLVTTLLFYFVYYRTKFCYNVRAISGDELIAKGNGIKIAKTKFLAYVVGSLFLGIAAIIQMSYATSMSAKLSMESLAMAFKPLMAMIIGVQLQDDVGLPGGIFIGAFMISSLFSGLVAMGLPATTQDIALGVFLVIVVSISTNTEAIAGFFGKFKKKSTA